ncbi:MAG: glycosyltransferase involved in cell wall biosynthesis [Saprospiraceae bacterium]|jgi:glycosyltransferase involved in cell wall biosynthesis
MKVLHFSSAKTWRGGEQQIAYLLMELRKLNIEQYVLCVANSSMEAFCIKEKFQFTRYKKRASIDPVPAIKLSKIVRQHHIDLVHIHDAHAHTFACISATFCGLKAPLVLSRRVDFPIRSGFLSRWKYNHPAIKAIICVSAFIKQVIEKDIRESAKIKVVHSGIDISKFHFQKNNILKTEFGIPLTSPLIANVAAIAPHKDYFTFVDTAAIILQKRPDARFLIIGGDGGEERAIRDYILQKKLSNKIQFTGFRKDIPEVLPGLDVFLFTSKEEGLGTSLLDALACKVPVVATNAGGAPEIIEHDKTGLVAEVKNSAQLAEHVLTVLDDEVLRNRLVGNGLEKLGLFTTEMTAGKTLGVYQTIIQMNQQ